MNLVCCMRLPSGATGRTPISSPQFKCGYLSSAMGTYICCYVYGWELFMILQRSRNLSALVALSSSPLCTLFNFQPSSRIVAVAHLLDRMQTTRRQSLLVYLL